MNTGKTLALIGLLRRGVLSRHAPLLAQLVVTRFCNLECKYCNEFDKTSQPVPIEALLRRVDALAALDTGVITCTGGEPLTHPELDTVIARIAGHRRIATVVTNGFLLTREWIERLNTAGLYAMQISIDAVEPDDVSKKSLKSVRGKLELLRRYADFRVNINSVLGISDAHTEDAYTVARAAKAFGFTSSVALLHDVGGQIKPFTDRQRATYHRIGELSHSFQHWLNYRLFQRNLLAGQANAWKCRAGARYLYICEHGMVHRCSQQRGLPGIPLARYSRTEIAREFATAKPCAARCTLNCVHQASLLDAWLPQQS